MFEGMSIFHWWVIGAQVAGLVAVGAVAVLTAVRTSKVNASEIADLKVRVHRQDLQIAEMPKAEIYGRLNEIAANVGKIDGRVAQMEGTLHLIQRSLLNE